jgi:hypothetical protein
LPSPYRTFAVILHLLTPPLSQVLTALSDFLVSREDPGTPRAPGPGLCRRLLVYIFAAVLLLPSMFVILVLRTTKVRTALRGLRRESGLGVREPRRVKKTK